VVQALQKTLSAAAAPSASAPFERRPARGGAVVMLTKDVQIDRRILLEADSLESAGWKVTIIAMPRDDRVPPDDTRVVRLRPHGAPAARRETLVLGLYAAVRRHVSMNGALMHSLRDFAWRHFVDQESFYLKLFEPMLASRPADVYMAHDLPLLPVALHAARLHQARLVYDSHELFTEQEFTEREKRGWRTIEAEAIRHCDAVITVNPSIARELENRYGVPRVHVVHNAERARPATPRTRRFHERLGLAPTDLVLLLQGGLSAGRHLEALVAAMGQVTDPRVHLVILGDGNLRTVLAKLAARERIAHRVHLLPAVPQQELLGWTEAADAGVIPYQATCLNNYYCTPNKLFEFIAAALPVLASDLPEIRRIVTGHGIGQVADLGDAPRIAAAIDEFFRDPSRLQGWREAATRARTVVNWDSEGARVVELFEALR
jgi:glycosyltransferase involved in cell wall biosynthesis